LEVQVPEFTQAFLKERDYIMAQAIRRELLGANVKQVVGVVGLALMCQV
jgi:pheromone shutdown protein TraB